MAKIPIHDHKCNLVRKTSDYFEFSQKRGSNLLVVITFIITSILFHCEMSYLNVNCIMHWAGKGGNDSVLKGECSDLFSSQTRNETKVREILSMILNIIL